VVEAHHGRVWVTSDAEAGTTFFLTLPTGKR
jgi:signal transduction histidine kinase